MVARRRTTSPCSDLAIEAYERALEPKRLVILPGAHFDAYTVAFDDAAGAAAEWFAQHLLCRDWQPTPARGAPAGAGRRRHRPFAGAGRLESFRQGIAVVEGLPAGEAGAGLVPPLDPSSPTRQHR